jgi:hypothetical protein
VVGALAIQLSADFSTEAETNPSVVARTGTPGVLSDSWISYDGYRGATGIHCHLWRVVYTRAIPRTLEKAGRERQEGRWT